MVSDRPRAILSVYQSLSPPLWSGLVWSGLCPFVPSFSSPVHSLHSPSSCLLQTISHPHNTLTHSLTHSLNKYYTVLLRGLFVSLSSLSSLIAFACHLVPHLSHHHTSSLICAPSLTLTLSLSHSFLHLHTHTTHSPPLHPTQGPFLQSTSTTTTTTTTLLSSHLSPPLVLLSLPSRRNISYI